MHARLLDVLHDRADDHLLAVAHGVHVHFHRLFQKAIQEHGRGVGDVHRLGEVAGKLGLVVDDFHGPAAQNVGRTHHQRIADLSRRGHAASQVPRRAVGRLPQTGLVDDGLEALAIFGAVDGVGAGADDGDAERVELVHQLERGLAAELHDHAGWLFHFDDGQHVLQRHRLEVEPIGGVVVRGYGLWIAVDHDGLEAVLAHGEGGVDAAVVELDALADAVGAAAEHHDLLPRTGRRFAFVFVGGVEVGGGGRELGGAGVYALEHRPHASSQPRLAHIVFGGAEQRGQPGIGEAVALQLPPLGGGYGFDRAPD